MKKKGFTLVELLAVILILGLIMIIVGRNLTETKREANMKEAEQIEKSIKDIAIEVYLDRKEEYNALSSGDSIEISLNELGSYLKSTTIKNPAGGEDCTGILKIEKTNGGPEFSSKLCCPGLYKTNEDGTCN